MVAGAGVGGLATLATAGLAQSGAYQEIDVPANAGKLSGRITYSGTEIEVPSIQVTKDHETCGHGYRAPRQLRVADDRALADCVVQIRNIRAGKPWEPEFDNGKIYQIDCTFQPYVQIIHDTAQVEIHNFDPLLHNIHAYEVFKKTRRSMFNFAQPQAGQVDTIDLNFRRGNVLMIDCNAHNWMSAWVYTSPTPYLNVTSIDGRFNIDAIPPGKYEFVVWHPLLGEKTAALSVGPFADLNFDIVLNN